MSTGMIEVVVTAVIPVVWIGGYFLVWDRKEARERTSRLDRQEVELILNGGYEPNPVAVAKGRPIRLLVTNVENNGRSWDYLDFPYLGTAYELPAGETVAIELPSLQPGQYAFFSGLGGSRGTLDVTV